jgi:uncharacterized protein YpmS
MHVPSGIIVATEEMNRRKDTSGARSRDKHTLGCLHLIALNALVCVLWLLTRKSETTRCTKASESGETQTDKTTTQKMMMGKK